MSFGRALRPSFVIPSAMAPLETMMTLRCEAAARAPPPLPPVCRPRRAATSIASLSHASPLRLFEPILMMTRRDFRRASRAACGDRPADDSGAREESGIADLGGLGDDLVERGLEPPLDVARQGRAREE